MAKEEPNISTVLIHACSLCSIVPLQYVTQFAKTRNNPAFSKIEILYHGDLGA